MTRCSLTLTFQFPSTKPYWQQDGSVWTNQMCLLLREIPVQCVGLVLCLDLLFFYYYHYSSPLWFDKYSATHHWSGQLGQLYRLLFVANGDERPDPSEKWRVPQWGDIVAASVARHDALGGCVCRSDRSSRRSSRCVWSTAVEEENMRESLGHVRRGAERRKFIADVRDKPVWSKILKREWSVWGPLTNDGLEVALRLTVVEGRSH